MRSRTRRSFKRSLCGLLAVLMSLQGVVVAGSVYVAASPAHDQTPMVVVEDAGTMPCDDMVMADIALHSVDSAPNEDCDGGCCDQGEGCDMAFCPASSSGLPATLPAADGVPHAMAAIGEFPPPSLGTIASMQGPPLRPPIT